MRQHVCQPPAKGRRIQQNTPGRIDGRREIRRPDFPRQFVTRDHPVRLVESLKFVSQGQEIWSVACRVTAAWYSPHRLLSQWIP